MNNESWDINNLPENHVLFTNVTFITKIDGTWNRKKQDGTNETAQKWDYITQETEEAPSMQISVYSATDHESLKLNVAYDIIAKKSIGKNGEFYGYTLKGFGETGKPILKKESQSRFQKSAKATNKQIALQSACTLLSGKTESPDDALMIAEVMLAWLNDEYTPIDTNVFDKEEKEKKISKK